MTASDSRSDSPKVTDTSPRNSSKNASKRSSQGSSGDAPKQLPSPVLPQLIVGLGNPGAKYEGTRHNIGFEVVERCARRWSVSLSETKKFQGWFGEGAVPGLGRVRLLKPTTFMNLSGQSIRAVVDWYKLDPTTVLIVYDDMDLPLGRLRLRLSGSAGGHNGMKSAIAHLGTQGFPRLRLGIGAPAERREEREETVGHVLGKFAPQERSQVDEVLQWSVDAIELALKQGVETAMNRYNTRSAGS